MNPATHIHRHEKQSDRETKENEREEEEKNTLRRKRNKVIERVKQVDGERENHSDRE